MNRFLPLVLLSAALACSSTPTQAVIVIEAPESLLVGENPVDEVELRIAYLDENGNTSTDPVEPEPRIIRVVNAFPVQHVVTPVGGDASRLFQIVATARNSNSPQSRVTLRGGYISGTVVTYTIRFQEGACSPNFCSGIENCKLNSDATYGYDCVPPTLQIPGADAGVPDSPDAGDASDVGCDPSGACDFVGECATNVTEECVDGVPICSFEPASTGTPCGELATMCAVRAACDGQSDICPDRIPEFGRVCNTATNEICNVNGECSPCIDGMPCFVDGNQCQRGRWNCVTRQCTNIEAAPDNTSCGVAPTAPCDAQNTCQSGICQDHVRDSEIECASGGGADEPCRAASFCNGITRGCSNNFVIGAGSCSECQECDGSGPTCVNSSTETPCGGLEGQCDPRRSCDGQGACTSTDGQMCGPMEEAVCNNGVCPIDGAECINLENPCTVHRIMNGSCQPTTEQKGPGTHCSVEGRDRGCQNGMCNDQGRCIAQTSSLGCAPAGGPSSSNSCTASATCNDEGTCMVDSELQCRQANACGAAGSCGSDATCDFEIYHGNPCEMGETSGLCSRAGTCTISRHPVISRVFRTMTTDDSMVLVEVYNPTSSTVENLGVLVNGSVNFPYEGNEGKINRYEYAVVNIGQVTTNTVELNLASTRVDTAPVPTRPGVLFERKACHGSTSRSMLESESEYGNAFSPPTSDLRAEFVHYETNDDVNPSTQLRAMGAGEERPSCSPQ